VWRACVFGVLHVHVCVGVCMCVRLCVCAAQEWTNCYLDAKKRSFDDILVLVN